MLWANEKSGINSEQPADYYTASFGPVAFSPDGSFLLARSADNSLRLWNSEGVFLRRIQLDFPVREAIFSPNNFDILVVGPDRFALVDLNGNVRFTSAPQLTVPQKPQFFEGGAWFGLAFQGKTHMENHIFNPDGKVAKVIRGHLVVNQQGDKVIKCDATGEQIGEVINFSRMISDDPDPDFAVVTPGPIVDMGFSADTSWLYITNPDHRLFLFRYGESRPSYILPLGAPLVKLEFSADGKFLYTLAAGSVKYWPLRAGQFLREARGPEAKHGFIQKLEFDEGALR
ncbi:MAG: hypothetical protein H6581_24310 [Bacteroidia bacterium]|nr:hypothetical protein [Bacteroidia bacterium]